MPSLRYNAYTAPRQAEPYRFGRLWTQPSLLMRNSTISTSKTELPARPAFTTIDDVIERAEALVNDLKKIGERKYPFDVRKASRKGEPRKEVKLTFGGYGNKRDSVQVRDGKRTYFIDVEETDEGKPYLRITESRFTGEGKDRERNSIVIFQEKAEEFAEAITQQAQKVSGK